MSLALPPSLDFRSACLRPQLMVLLLAILFPFVGAEVLLACEGFSKGTIVTVHASVSSYTLRQVDEAELLTRFSRAWIHRSPLAFEQRLAPGHDFLALSANVGLGYLQVRRSISGVPGVQSNLSVFGNTSMDIIGCGLVSGALSETLASTAQLALDGASIQWSSASIESQSLHRGVPTQTASRIDSETFSPRRVMVAEYSSSFSKAAIWRTGSELQLVLNDIVMSDTRDERIYHEMLVQPALLAAERVHRVLIIGGGEGAGLREVLRDQRVKHIDMVEIDEGLVNFCRTHLEMMHEGSFDSSKYELHFEDGAMFAWRAPDAIYDVVIVDGIDFSRGGGANYGNALFALSFYRDLFRILRQGGVLAQYMSDVDGETQMLSAGFTDVQKLGVDIPSFYGAGARFLLAAKGHPEKIRDRLHRRVSEVHADRQWTYFSPGALELSLNHSARCLKGYNPTIDGDANMLPAGYVCFFSFIGIYTFCCVLGFLYYRKMCCFRQWDGCHYEHHPIVHAKCALDGLKLEFVVPRNCGPGTTLRVMHPSGRSHFLICLPHNAHCGKLLTVSQHGKTKPGELVTADSHLSRPNGPNGANGAEVTYGSGHSRPESAHTVVHANTEDLEGNLFVVKPTRSTPEAKPTQECMREDTGIDRENF